MRGELIAYLKTFREEVIASFESLEERKSFERKAWSYEKGKGGGEIATLRGAVFEKAAVNFSEVAGDRFPGSDGEGPFFATGVSLITHMASPYMPTVHMNIRFIETEKKKWFGGGFDLTPMGFPFDEDTIHFHQAAKEALDPFGKEIYPEFRDAAKEYFYIPHRKKERGVGGIFFDHYNTGDVDRDTQLWKAVGSAFLKAIMPIYKRRLSLSYGEQEKRRQLELRGHYAEFNLHYDRGTKFGFLSGGNPEAILSSMPPLCAW